MMQRLTSPLRPPSLRLAAGGWLLAAICWAVLAAWRPVPHHALGTLLEWSLAVGQVAGLFISAAGFYPAGPESSPRRPFTERLCFILIQIAWMMLILANFATRN